MQCPTTHCRGKVSLPAPCRVQLLRLRLVCDGLRNNAICSTPSPAFSRLYLSFTSPSTSPAGGLTLILPALVNTSRVVFLFRWSRLSAAMPAAEGALLLFLACAACLASISYHWAHHNEGRRLNNDGTLLTGRSASWTPRSRSCHLVKTPWQ